MVRSPVPDLPAGLYHIQCCNHPCTVEALGDLIGSDLFATSICCPGGAPVFRVDVSLLGYVVETPVTSPSHRRMDRPEAPIGPSQTAACARSSRNERSGGRRIQETAVNFIGLEPGAFHMRPRCETRVTVGSAPSGRLRSTNLRTVGGKPSLASAAHSSLKAVIRDQLTHYPAYPVPAWHGRRSSRAPNSAFWARRARPAFVPRTTGRRQEKSGAGASNPQVRSRARALPQVAKSAPRTVSRWRHGFKSRWDYQHGNPRPGHQS
jgi:hypothetical protein